MQIVACVHTTFSNEIEANQVLIILKFTVCSYGRTAGQLAAFRYDKVIWTDVGQVKQFDNQNFALPKWFINAI